VPTAINWGIIGCGDVCEVKSAPAYQQVEGFTLLAVMSRRLQKAADFAQRHKISKFYDNATALINDPDIHAVYIATPPDSHHDYALQVAAAGKICCVEKPMALNYTQCVAMLQAFSAKNLPLFVAYYRRCLPSFLQIKQIITSGELGKIRHIDWQYRRPPSANDLAKVPNWRTEKNIAKGGYFEDIASHGLDLMTFLLGHVARASGMGSQQQGLYSAYDAITASLLFENGVTGSAHWNFASANHVDSMHIIGERGDLCFSVFNDSPAVFRTNDKSSTYAMPKPSPIQQDFVNAIALHLAGQTIHPSLAQSASHTNWLMDQILATSP
jgi:1,5-anhydro-D-fructose reductase (1,5-anhydro-D-mannitol-forming)